MTDANENTIVQSLQGKRDLQTSLALVPSTKRVVTSIMNPNYVISCISFILCFACASINKTRLCVEYEIPDYWAEEKALSVIPGMTRAHCMTQCVRQPLCRAFNFRPVDGNCRLLPEYLDCRTPNTTVGWLYVSLSTCSQRQPWQSTRPMESGWQWITSENPSVRNGTLQFGRRFASRIHHKGLYLPGWWSPWPRGIFRGAIPHEERRQNCDVGEFLVLPDPARFIWTPVNMRNPAPINAVIGGYAADSTPLYVARRLINSDMMPGFYNAAKKMLVIVYNSYTVYTTGDLLLFVWIAHDCSMHREISTQERRRKWL